MTLSVFTKRWVEPSPGGLTLSFYTTAIVQNKLSGNNDKGFEMLE